MSLGSKPGLQVLLIFLAGILLSLPCLLYGLPASSNALTHVRYQHHFSGQFWNGESYPRWLVDENKGFGSPIFVAQYPLPYYLTAFLRPIVPFPKESRDSRELGLFCYLALASAGVAAWFWLRKFTGPFPATASAIVYMSLPFVLQDGIYARGAIGELCTFIWMPLALSTVEAIHKKRSAVFILGALFALLILSNLLTTLLFVPALALYAIVFGRQEEPSLFKRALPIFFSGILGIGMAAIYVIPAITHRHLFDLDQMESVLTGYQFALYFLHLTSSDLESRQVPLALGAALVLAGVAAWHIWKTKDNPRVRVLLGVILALATLALIPNFGQAFIRLSGFHLQPAPPNNFSGLMLLVIFFTVVLGLLSYCRTAKEVRTQREVVLFYIFAASLFFMLPFSAPIWKLLPGSSAVQFPFRLGGTFTLAVVGLLAIALESCVREPQGTNRPSQLVIALVTLATIGGGLLTWKTHWVFLHPWPTSFDATQDVDPMYRAYLPSNQLFAFAKVLGTNPYNYKIVAMPEDQTLEKNTAYPDCNLSVRRESPKGFFVSSDCVNEAHIRLKLLYSPLWRIVPVQATSGNPTVGVSSDGLAELTFPPGKYAVRLVFDLGSPGRIGMIVSLVSFVVCLAGFFFSLRGPKLAT